jgi:O-antigen ligase
MKSSSSRSIFSSIIILLAQLYLLLFPFGQIFRFTFFRPDIHLYPTDIIIGLTAFVFVVHIITTSSLRGLHPFFRNKQGRGNPVWKLLPRLLNISQPLLPLFLFIAWAAFSLLLNPLNLTYQKLLVSGLYWFRLVAYLLFFLAIFQSLKTTPRNTLQLLKTLFLSGALFVIFGFLQLLFLPDFSVLHRAGWDEHLYRLTSTFLDPGFTGIILVFFSLIIISLIIQRSAHLNFSKLFPKRRISPNSAYYILLISTFSALLLTYSRASYLSFLAGVAIISWVKKSPKLFIAAFTFILVFTTFIPKPPGEGGYLARTSTLNSRLINYRQSFEISKGHPFTGVGFNTYRYAQIRYGFISSQQSLTSHSASGADNSFLFILATTGIIGLALFVWFTINLLRTLFIILPINPLSLPALASVISLLIHSNFHNTLFYPLVIGYLAILLAFTMSNNRKIFPRLF